MAASDGRIVCIHKAKLVLILDECSGELLRDRLRDVDEEMP